MLATVFRILPRAAGRATLRVGVVQRMRPRPVGEDGKPATQPLFERGLQGREERIAGAFEPGSARHRGQNIMIRTAGVDAARSRIGPVEVWRPGEVRARRSSK